MHNVERGTFHGVSWGSRRLYTWRRHHGHGGGSSSRWVPNAEATIDYQDCHYRGVEYMLCGGVQSYATPGGPIAFGGLDLVDLRRDRPEHQIPVNLFVDEGAGPNPNLALTHNAFWVQPLDGRSLRFYFMTESDLQADLLDLRRDAVGESLSAVAILGSWASSSACSPPTTAPRWRPRRPATSSSPPSATPWPATARPRCGCTWRAPTGRRAGPTRSPRCATPCTGPTGRQRGAPAGGARARHTRCWPRAAPRAIATERDRERVREAAELLLEAGEHRAAGEAYESLGDDGGRGRAPTARAACST